MQNTANPTLTVDRPSRTVSTKLPREWRGLLDMVSQERGETCVSETVRALIAAEIERHFPGGTQGAT